MAVLYYLGIKEEADDFQCWYEHTIIRDICF